MAKDVIFQKQAPIKKKEKSLGLPFPIGPILASLILIGNPVWARDHLTKEVFRGIVTNMIYQDGKWRYKVTPDKSTCPSIWTDEVTKVL